MSDYEPPPTDKEFIETLLQLLDRLYDFAERDFEECRKVGDDPDLERRLKDLIEVERLLNAYGYR